MHLLANLPLSVLGFAHVVTVLFTCFWLTFTVIGFPLFAAGLMSARHPGKPEWARARALLLNS